MTPKEKAEELVNKFTPHTKVFHEHLGWVNYLDSTKQCALIAVNEMLEELDHLAFDDFDYGTSKMMYWIEVKNEINNL